MLTPMNSENLENTCACCLLSTYATLHIHSGSGMARGLHVGTTVSRKLIFILVICF